MTTTLPFTDRDIRVLALVAEGLTDSRIGARLGLSSRTIKAELIRIRAALGARNRAHAVALAFLHGILPTNRSDDD